MKFLKKFLKTRGSFFIKLAVATLLIAFVSHAGYLKLAVLKDLLTVPACLAGFLLVGINILLLNWRWYYLLRTRGFVVGLWQTFNLYVIGIFFNHALPSSVGGDVVKAYYISQEQSSRRLDAVLSVLIDRLLGLYSLLLLALLAILWDFSFVTSHPQVRTMALLCLLAFAGMSLALWVGFSKSLDQKLKLTEFLKKQHRLHAVVRMFDAMKIYGELKSTIVISVAVSLVAQLFTLWFFVLISQVLGIHDVSIATYLFCVPLGFVATALPIAPAGVGVGQVAFLFLFQAYSPGSGVLGTAGVTAYQLCTLMWGLVGAIFYLRYKRPELTADPAEPMSPNSVLSL